MKSEFSQSRQGTEVVDIVIRQNVMRAAIPRSGPINAHASITVPKPAEFSGSTSSSANGTGGGWLPMVGFRGKGPGWWGRGRG